MSDVKVASLNPSIQCVLFKGNVLWTDRRFKCICHSGLKTCLCIYICVCYGLMTRSAEYHLLIYYGFTSISFEIRYWTRVNCLSIQCIIIATSYKLLFVAILPVYFFSLSKKHVEKIFFLISRTVYWHFWWYFQNLFYVYLFLFWCLRHLTFEMYIT